MERASSVNTALRCIIVNFDEALSLSLDNPLTHSPAFFFPGSEEERIAVETACRFGSKPDVYSTPMAEDVRVEVRMAGEGPRMGADARLSIVLKNLSSEPRRTTLHSQVAVMYYTGVMKGTIKKEQLPVELSPNEGWFSLKWTREAHQGGFELFR